MLPMSLTDATLDTIEGRFNNALDKIPFFCFDQMMLHT